MLNNNVDKMALKILSRYNSVSQLYARSPKPLRPYQQQWIEEFGFTSNADLAYLKERGLAFDLVDMTHDEAVKKCFEYIKKCKKSHLTDVFLSSFASGYPELRSDFAAYAMMQTMPDHSFIDSHSTGCCDICSGSDTYTDMDTTEWNADRFRYGSMGPLKVPFVIQFHLAQHLQGGHHTPTPEDFRIFNDIIDVLRSVDATAKPKEMQKHLKKIGGFKATNDQWKRLLEALGVAGILETEQHKGYLTRYTNPGLAPSKSSSSNWAYPVDFWTGADGVNMRALEFWFGDYPEIRLE